MNKFLCVSAVAASTLFGAIPAAHAQFKFTPEVGITMMKEGHEDQRATVSPRLGVGVDYFFNKQGNGWAITSGLYYYYKRESYSYASAMVDCADGTESWIFFPFPEYGGTMSSMADATDIKSVEFVNVDTRRDFLQLPVMAKYKWQINEDYALSAAAGLYVTVGVGGTYDLQFSNYEKGDEEGKKSTMERSPYDSYYDRFEWGFTTRLSLQVKQVSLNLNYDRNFETKHWMEAENLVSVSAGYTF